MYKITIEEGKDRHSPVYHMVSGVVKFNNAMSSTGIYVITRENDHMFILEPGDIVTIELEKR